MKLLMIALHAILGWNDFEHDNTYQLIEPVTLSPRITLAAGTQLDFYDQIPLDDIRVQIFQFYLVECSPEIEDTGTPVELHRKIYGVDLVPGCMFEVYVENGDLSKESFFSYLK